MTGDKTDREAEGWYILVQWSHGQTQRATPSEAGLGSRLAACPTAHRHPNLQRLGIGAVFRVRTHPSRQPCSRRALAHTRILAPAGHLGTMDPAGDCMGARLVDSAPCLRCGSGRVGCVSGCCACQGHEDRTDHHLHRSLCFCHGRDCARWDPHVRHGPTSHARALSRARRGRDIRLSGREHRHDGDRVWDTRSRGRGSGSSGSGYSSRRGDSRGQEDRARQHAAASAALTRYEAQAHWEDRTDHLDTAEAEAAGARQVLQARHSV